MNNNIEQGVLAGARYCPSPNYGPRPPGVVPDLLVIHNISLPPKCYGGPEIERFFCNQLDWSAHPWFEEIRGVEVSSHLLIRRSGEVLQFVSFEDRAWHAGQSSFRGRQDCNDFSIGVELEGSDDQAYSDAQYSALVRVVRLLMAEYPIPDLDHVVGHCDIAPRRKTDPGPAFDWQRLRDLVQRGVELK